MGLAGFEEKVFLANTGDHRLSKAVSPILSEFGIFTHLIAYEL